MPSIKPPFVKLIAKVLAEAETKTSLSPKDPARFFFLRPSGFPYCGLQKALSIEELEDTHREANLASNYFTDVGTAAHSVFQKYVGLTGKQVGNYTCKNTECNRYNKTKKFTTKNICSSCGQPMQYEELEFKLDSLLGHADGVYELTYEGKKFYVLIDYKTTSVKKIWQDKKQKIFPYKGNVAQIEVYVTAIEKAFDIKISGHALIYLPRDTPLGQNVKICFTKTNDEHKKALKVKLLRTIKIHNKVLKAKTVEDFEVLKKYKLCKSLRDYKENYEDEHNQCPYLSKCFSSKIDDVIKRSLKEHSYPLIQHAPKKIRDELCS